MQHSLFLLFLRPLFLSYNFHIAPLDWTHLVLGVSTMMMERFATIGVFILSLGAGALITALLAGRKAMLAHLFSFITDFILLIWAAKLVLNAPQFFQEPIAILSLPAGSSAFYLAAVGSVALVLSRIRKGVVEAGILPVLLQFFFLSSFLFEFIGYISSPHPATVINLLLYGCLALFSQLARLTPINSILFSVLLWAAGSMAVLSVQPIISVFGFVLAPWFVLTVALAVVGMVQIVKKEGFSWT